jgi:hypothetical protein
MHASIEELLSLRDDEPVAAATAAHVGACAHCRSELEQLRHVRSALGSLPRFEPARGSWEQIVARAGARPAQQRRRSWAMQGALAAAAAFAVVAVLRSGDRVEPAPAHPVAATAQPAPRATPSELNTEALIERSHRLERAALAMVRYEPQVVNASTLATIATLEDQLALVDYRLSLDAVDPLAPEQSHQLWKQRVDLMDSLVNVRYAQLQRVAY